MAQKTPEQLAELHQKIYARYMDACKKYYENQKDDDVLAFYDYEIWLEIEFFASHRAHETGIIAHALCDDIANLYRKIAKLDMENTHLRVVAQKVGCLYGHRDENGACRLGYPGCACMDDLLAMQAWCPEDEDKVAVRLGKRIFDLEAQVDVIGDARACISHLETVIENFVFLIDDVLHELNVESSLSDVHWAQLKERLKQAVKGKRP